MKNFHFISVAWESELIGSSKHGSLLLKQSKDKFYNFRFFSSNIQRKHSKLASQGNILPY